MRPKVMQNKAKRVNPGERAESVVKARLDRGFRTFCASALVVSLLLGVGAVEAFAVSLIQVEQADSSGTFQEVGVIQAYQELSKSVHNSYNAVASASGSFHPSSPTKLASLFFVDTSEGLSINHSWLTDEVGTHWISTYTIANDLFGAKTHLDDGHNSTGFDSYSPEPSGNPNNLSTSVFDPEQASIRSARQRRNTVPGRARIHHHHLGCAAVMTAHSSTHDSSTPSFSHLPGRWPIEKRDRS